MSIENQDVDLNNDQDLSPDDHEGTAGDDQQGDDTHGDDDKPADDEKPQGKKQFTPEQQLAIHERQAKKLRKQLGMDSDEPKGTKKEAPKSGDIDYGQLAFYNTKSDAVKIESNEDIEFLRETIAETGKSQEALLSSKWFQAELKERAEDRASSKAVPKGSKRSSQSSRDSVDYWLAKGVLPDDTPENQDLRRKVVDARIARETNGSRFAPSPTGRVTRQSQLR